MEKNVRVGKYSFPVRSTAATLMSYRRNFGRDGMKDLLALVKDMGGNKEIDETEAVNAMAVGDFEMDTIYRFTWVFAKSGDPSIPPLEEWLDTFDVPALDFVSKVFPQISDLLFSMAKTKVKPKKPYPPKKRGK